MVEHADLDNPRNRAKILTAVKKQMADGDFSPVQMLLEHLATYSSLVCVREQKLLLKVEDVEVQRQLASLYKKTARRVVSDSHQRRYEEHYAEFVLIASQARRQVAARVSSILQNFPKLSFLTLLRIATESLSSSVDEIRHKGWSQADIRLN